MRRDTVKAYRARAKAIDATIDQALAQIQAEKDAARAAGMAAYKAKRQLVPFTDQEWSAARLVRTGSMWHKVIRVNAKSVTVETGNSWTDRIVRARVHEVRT